MIDNTEPPVQYEFDLDPKDVYESMGDVGIMVTLKWNTDPNVARAEIEKLTTNIGYVNYLWISSTFLCYTDADTCKDVFSWEVVKEEKREPGVSYTVEGYRQLNAAEVPEGLEDIVQSVALNRHNEGVGW